MLTELFKISDYENFLLFSENDQWLLKDVDFTSSARDEIPEC